MPISFPLSPSYLDTYSYGGRTWIWNGTAWDSVGTIQGSIGPFGPQGTQGFQGSQGPTGIQGIQGAQGVQGFQGPNAAISFGPTPPVSPLIGDRWVDSNSGIEYTWIDDGSNQTWVEVSASGFSGAQGTQGIQGSNATMQGVQGLQGFEGGKYTISATPPLSPQVGDAWLDTNDARLYIWNQYEWFEPNANLNGFTGAQGTQGLQGTDGAFIAQGIQGLQGTQGPQSIQGPQGPQGVQGNLGPQGIQGTQGIVGPKGDLGSQGIQGNQGLQGINNAVQGFSLQNTGATTNYTLVITDKDVIVQTNNSSANTVTIPLNSTVAFPIGTLINVLQLGTGQTSFVATGGVTIQSESNKLRMFGQYAVAGLLKTDINTWVLFGNTVL